MEKKLYWSKRNFMFKSEKYGWLLYSGLSNSFFSLSEKMKCNLDEYLMGNGDLPQNVLESFEKTGILSKYTDEEYDSLYMLNWLKIQKNQDTINYTIAPTLNCNFRCSYCYEKNAYNTRVMEKIVLEKLIAFSKRNLKSKIRVEWYGGEPLLALEHIKYFNLLAKQNEIELKQVMITNGYLISEEVLKFFQEINLKGLQITLDGRKEIHNKRRPHIYDSDSYSRIMDNLDLLYNFSKTHNYEIFVSIRVNIDKTNEEDYPLIKKYFEDRYGDFFYVYYGIVKNYNSCLSQADDSFDKYDEGDFYQLLNSKYNLHSENFYPRKCGTVHCQAQFIDHYVIDSDGYMYKCYNDIGYKDKAIYSLKDGKKVNLKREADFIINQQVIFNQNCKSCFLMFSCQGGCPYEAIENKRKCPVLKENIKEYLEKTYEKVQKKEQLFVY